MIKAFVFDAYGTLYDVQSVADMTEAAYPGHGDYITQVWRLKQLEYSWLHSMMHDYQDFWTVTREALAYTLNTLGLSADERHLAELADAYNRLRPYPDAGATLAGLSEYRCAILSNGSPSMLAKLVENSGLYHLLEAVISVEPKRVFKPDPRAYELVEEVMGLRPEEVVFVSSNGFDACGAKRFGFRVAQVARLPPATLREELAGADVIGPRSMFRALRMQPETHGQAPDFVVPSLHDLIQVARADAAGPAVVG